MKAQTVAAEPKKPAQAQPQRHVVMAVPGGIARDIRVRKMAASVQALGYRLTLLYLDPTVKVPTEQMLDGIRTVGVPFSLSMVKVRDKALRERRLKKMKRRFGYRIEKDQLIAQQRLTSLRLRRPTEKWHPTAWYRLVFWIRSTARAKRLRRVEKWEEKRDSWNWRAELLNVASVEVAFGPLMRQLEPDILHIHDWPTLWAAVNAKRYLAKRSKTVQTIYDAHEYVAGQHLQTERIRRAATSLQAEAIGQFDAVITVSQAIADRLQADHALDQTPTVIFNVPPLHQGGEEPPQTLRELIDLPDEVPLVVYSGGINPVRNLPNAIEAFQWLEGVHLAIIAVPNTTCVHAQDLQRQIEELGLEDRIHLVEPVQPDQIISFVSTADLGLHPMIGGLPNHEMALPNKIFDYLRAGLPIAVSNLATMSQFVKHWGVGEVFDWEDPESIAAAIRRVLDNHAALAAATNNQEMRQAYSWERQEEHLAKLYQSLDDKATAAQ
ncbi:MAG: glycosyltransferase family 4 protein [Micrococcales bacterium]|nr:glycosyltransferase family 4 protein [Micrococcales bacterium]